MPEQYDWDFFIAHAGPDARVAERLYEHLNPKSRVFLDSRNLLLGDNWDTVLPKAQQTSLVTVVLISSKTEVAYYQREEIAAAIALARENAENHRVVPVFLNEEAKGNDSVPYGLRLKHGLTVSEKLSLKTVAAKLLDLLPRLAGMTGHNQETVTAITDRNSKEKSPRPLQIAYPEDLVDFDEERRLFKAMLADAPEKRLMFIQAPGGRGKTSLLRMLAFLCEEEGVPYCSIDSRGQPYDNPQFTLAMVICDQLGLSPRHIARALQFLSVYRPEGEINDPYIVSQILTGVNVTHDALRQRHIKERLKNAFHTDLGQLVGQDGRVVCLFDSYERLSEEEEEWLLDTLLWPIASGKLRGVTIVTTGHRWPKINKWEWEKNAHLIDGLPRMDAEHIKMYAEKLDIKITDDEARHYWKASGGGIPYYMALVINNLRAVSEVA
jgi:hypothetical protein